MYKYIYNAQRLDIHCVHRESPARTVDHLRTTNMKNSVDSSTFCPGFVACPPVENHDLRTHPIYSSSPQMLGHHTP